MTSFGIITLLHSKTLASNRMKVYILGILEFNFRIIGCSRMEARGGGAGVEPRTR